MPEDSHSTRSGFAGERRNFPGQDEAPKSKKRGAIMTRRRAIALGVAAGVVVAGAGSLAATYNPTDTSINGPGAFNSPENESGNEAGGTLPVRCAILYASMHAGNTLKLVRAIKRSYPDVQTFDAVSIPHDQIDLSAARLVVLASGVYFGSFAKELLSAAKSCLQPGQKVLIVYTSGALSEKFDDKAADIVTNVGADLVGTYDCVGAYRMFKFLPISHEGHPTEEEVHGAVAAFKSALGELA